MLSVSQKKKVIYYEKLNELFPDATLWFPAFENLMAVLNI